MSSNTSETFFPGHPNGTPSDPEQGADSGEDLSVPPEFIGKQENILPNGIADPFEVTLDPADDPKNLPEWRKWAIIFVISTGTLCATSASSMVSALS